jgi:CheY-like chemotaxis protein
METLLCRGPEMGQAGVARATTPPHVLVIDDDESLRALYQEVIDELGFGTTTWHRTVETCDPVVALAPSLIVLDLMFGGQALGARFLHHLKSDPRTAAIPVVIATAAYDAVAELAPSLSRWDCPVLLKPFNLDDLLTLLLRLR